MTCNLCKSFAANRQSLTRLADVAIHIRGWVEWNGCEAHRVLALDARDAKDTHAYCANSARACCRSRAPEALRCARRLALVAWVLKRLDVAQIAAMAAQAAHEQAFAGLPLATVRVS